MWRDFQWVLISLPELAEDVDVAADNSVWLTMRSHRYYVLHDGSIQPRYVAVLLPIFAVSGIAAPIFADNSPSPAGRAWGVSYADRELIYSDGVWRGTSTPRIVNVADLSTAPSSLWMVKTDGSVWTTTDGMAEVPHGTITAARIAGCHDDTALCVSRDGGWYIWIEKTL